MKLRSLAAVGGSVTLVCLFAAACGGGDEGSGNGSGGSGTGGSGTGGSGTGGASTGGGTSGGAGGVSGGGAGGASGGAGATDGGNKCGDFVCEPSECGTCAPDCGAKCQSGGGCGDGKCDTGETCSSCPADCQKGCGDGCCLMGEDCKTCAADCKTVESCDPSACGNGQCNYGLSETCLNCADCTGLCDCGDNQCVAPETHANCPWDCKT